VIELEAPFSVDIVTVAVRELEISSFSCKVTVIVWSSPASPLSGEIEAHWQALPSLSIIAAVHAMSDLKVIVADFTLDSRL